MAQMQGEDFLAIDEFDLSDLRGTLRASTLAISHVTSDPATFGIDGSGLEKTSAGDDIVDITAQLGGYGTLDGGAGTDTLRLNPATPPTTANGQFGPYQINFGLLSSATLLSFERLAFNSTANTVMIAQFAYGGNNAALNQIGPGLAANSEIVGGAGFDTVTLRYASANLPGTVTAPSGFTYTNWFTPTRAYLPGDSVSINVSGSGATTINGTAHAGVQVLNGGSGSDVINGSNDMDSLSGGAGGSDQLFGNGGNDTFNVVNTYVYNTGFAGSESTLTAAGSLFDGGSGTDFLVFGGHVNFLGTVQNIEGIYLQPGYFNSNDPAQPLFLGSQYDTVVTIASSTFAALPSNLELDGIGLINVRMGDGGESFNGSGFVYDPGSAVLFEVDGGAGNDQITGTAFADLLYGNGGNDTLVGNGGDDSISGGDGNDSIDGGIGDDDLNGDAGNDIINGGDGNDIVAGWLGNDTLTGGIGSDDFRPGIGIDTIVDFANGIDLINLYDTGISSLAQLFSHAVQVGADVVMTIAIDEFTFSKLTIKNVTLAQLDESDFNFAPTFGATTVGSEGNDLLYGLDGDFFITLAFGGNDTIVSGPSGHDRRISAGDGNDIVILSDPVPDGIFMGEAGFDTLVLRPRGATSVTGNVYNFTDFGGLSNTIDIRSFEALQLDSAANTVFNVAIELITYDNAMTVLIGGAGTDIVSTGLYNGFFPTLSFANWSADDTVVFYGSQYFTTIAATGTHPGLYRIVGSDVADTITGTVSRDRLEGGLGDDTLNGNGGIDSLYGGDGTDRLIVDASGSGTTVDGGTGTDTLAVSGAVSLGGIASIEAIELTAGSNLTLTTSQLMAGLAPNTQLSGSGTITVNLEANVFTAMTGFQGVGAPINFVLNGSSGDDYIKAAHFNNTINGGVGRDFIRGGNGVDTIDGGADNDKITGWGGADILTGGSGSDQFRYFYATDSGTGAAADRITDFTIGSDVIDLRLLDKDLVTPDIQNYTLSFVGSSAFGAGGAGQIRYAASGADMLVQLDLDGNGTSDMEIVLQGLAGQTLSVNDFLFGTNPTGGSDALSGMAASEPANTPPPDLAAALTPSGAALVQIDTLHASPVSVVPIEFLNDPMALPGHELGLGLTQHADLLHMV
jgi:Ca2+-binding RTX toxin-like protein